jgi:hypothetical protein
MKYRLTATAALVFALAMLMRGYPALAFCGFAAALITAVGYAAAKGGLG